MACWNVLWICLACTVHFTISLDVIKLERETCLYEMYDLESDTEYQVEWDGGRLPTKCRIGFVIPDSNKLTVEATRFYVMDCDFNISYVYNSKMQHNYSCNSRPRKMEIEDIKYFYLEVMSSGRVTTSKFEIKITLEKFNWTNWFLLLLLFGGIIGIIYCLRKEGMSLRDCPGKICDCCCEACKECECERRCNSLRSDCSDYLPDCTSTSESRTRNPVVARQPNTAEITIVTEPTDDSQSAISSAIDFTDIHSASDPTAPPPPPTSLQMVIYNDYERPPPSYEDCVDVDESPPPYPATR